MANAVASAESRIIHSAFVVSPVFLQLSTFNHQPIRIASAPFPKQTHPPCRFGKNSLNLPRCHERADDFENEADGLEISDRLASILTAELASHAEQMLKDVSDPKERWQRLQEFLPELRHLRHEDHNCQRNQLQRQRWEREVERQDEEDLKLIKEENKRRLKQISLSPMFNQAVAECFGSGEYGKKMAEMIHRIEFDLPLDDLLDKEIYDKTHSNAIKPNPTESDQIKPIFQTATPSANHHDK